MLDLTQQIIYVVASLPTEGEIMVESSFYFGDYD